jgi:hypothetical protein
MNRTFRRTFFVIAIAQGVIGIALALQIAAVTQIWQAVFPGATPLSLTFVGSIFAAASASTLWCIAVSGEEGALTGVALDYIVILIPAAIYAFQSTGGSTPLLIFAVTCVLGVIFGAYLLFQCRSIPIQDSRPQPRWVRLSFGIFIVALLLVGGGMVLKVSNIMPWPLSINESVVYGWMFLGAAAYFTYALLRPSWGNSDGQLAGFLAYDLVLILPFLARFGTEMPSSFLPGHIIYTIVVMYSGVLATYYLFLNPKTRVQRQHEAMPSPTS